MKAKTLLQYVNELFPDIVTIAKDWDGEVWFYNTTEVYKNDSSWYVEGDTDTCGIKHNPLHNKDIEWESENWYECIEILETKEK